MRRLTKLVCLLGLFAWLVTSLWSMPARPVAAAGDTIYLPFVARNFDPLATQRRVNAPYVSNLIGPLDPGDDPPPPDWKIKQMAQMAVFWFGRVNPIENYTDVRIAYTDTELVIYTATIDRLLWYDTSPSPADLTQWDSITVYVNTTGNTGGAPTTNAFRLDAQLRNDPGDSPSSRASYQGNGSGWASAAVPFTMSAGWRGQSINDNTDDKGWVMTFRIPFASLGLSKPADGTVWGLSVVTHDRDSLGGPANADKTWPETADPNSAGTWGQLRFGLASYAPPPITGQPTTTTIRHKLNGAVVKDVGVGGYTVCGGNLNYWTQWGDTNEAAYFNPAGPAPNFNVQNQSDISDYPCFSKIYLTFPLSQIPAGKVIRSATLTLYQMGNSGAGSNGQGPFPSQIQVLTVGTDWDPTTITWNNAPLALQNFGASQVDPIAGCGSTIAWPCVPRTWNVSLPVVLAYGTNKPLYLVLYSADDQISSGKYFTSSDTGDWNYLGRPTLTVEWGNP